MRVIVDAGRPSAAAARMQESLAAVRQKGGPHGVGQQSTADRQRQALEKDWQGVDRLRATGTTAWLREATRSVTQNNATGSYNHARLRSSPQ